MKRWMMMGALAAILLGALAFTPPSNKYFEIIKNLEIFANIYKEINAGYVDELDPARTMRIGIDAMLGHLDPYTNYISESEIEGYRTLSEGRYRGIGAQVRKIGEYVTITQVYENSPALKAGLKAGDIILEVDGQSARDRSTDDLNNIMQGTPGTQVRFRIERPGEKKPFNLHLTRAEVDIPNVPYAGLVSDDVGYISLTTFTQMAGLNISSALRDLKTESPDLKGIIIDLRDNGGGLLHEAVNICNIFLPKNELIVSTRSKTPASDRTYKTMSDPEDPDIPVVILVNNRSASASEIVSGALQDFDRGVVMGQLTFGKGLVQNTKEIGYNSRIKITTAKYYIPSGRCIQALRYKDGEPEHIPEAERARFKTRNGRTVLDGGGVLPDIVLEKPDDPALLKALDEQNILFDFVTGYCLGKDSIAPPDRYRFAEWDEFLAFLKERKFTYQTASDQALLTLKEQAAKEQAHALLQPSIQKMETELRQFREQNLITHKDEIIRRIELDVIGRYYYDRGRKQMGLRNDAEVEAAIQLLNDPSRYHNILKG
jgi:carboxyl-terminal processing protease